jgi:hypothetical protein
MVSGLILGNIALLTFMAKRGIGDSIVARRASIQSSRRGLLWFFSTASAGLVARTVLQSLAVLLGPSSITLLNVAFKIVGSLSVTFVNTTMPLLVHAESDSPRLGRRFLRVATVAVGTTGVVAIVGVGFLRPDYFLPAMVIAIWLIGSSAAAVANRMSYRFLTPRVTGTRSIIALGLITGLAVLSTHQPGFNLIVLLCAYAAIDGANATLLLWALKDRLMSAVNAALVLAVISIGAVVAV